MDHPLTDDHKQDIVSRLSWMGFGVKVLAMLMVLATAVASLSIDNAKVWIAGGIIAFLFSIIDFCYLSDERAMRQPKQDKFPGRSALYYLLLWIFCIAMYRF